jgi:hypothetical protein
MSEEQGFKDAVSGITACPFGDIQRAQEWAKGHDRAFDSGQGRIPRLGRRAKGVVAREYVMEVKDKLDVDSHQAEEIVVNNLEAELRKQAAIKPPMRFKGSEKLHPVGNRNPRRPDSHGFRSLQLIIDNPGIRVDEFREKGGRLNDLRWDLAHGNVEMRS